ncbi:ferric enterobactin transport ATP-binding protein FepC [Phaeobacter piscinae]|uniref:Ferric enterobactin transport ATP-binding protein FepC n=1 Tax=Phaeobacter piscinae TaxID=1580596 RepID=A0AAN1GSB9_9RHOB|nr:ABC transporter ATP-binding protein [Phaeobacter piscinae]ATG44277.1 ferric enterobactin transport ATP-binding protein FepC [Phaeobacter piscinae]AUR36591.1 ferric enterobactin transport ATP-binding protein FepC [Phaeobacter piscinae]
MAATARLRAEDLSVSYSRTPVLNSLSTDLPDGALTVIVGPNACGKSTLLRALARLQPAGKGQVLLDGKAIHRQGSRAVAQRLAILPQTPTAPEGLTVRDLATRGRTPHQSPLRQWSRQDAEAVTCALDLTHMTPHADRPLEALSGGQRQRAWIAMALAQDTDILLLDEPTTYLDLPHQIELLKLVQQLNRDTGRTVVMVLHDINLAARFASHMIALKDGQVFCEGPPDEVITEGVMQSVFALPCRIIADPVHGSPHVIPE